MHNVQDYSVLYNMWEHSQDRFISPRGVL